MTNVRNIVMFATGLLAVLAVLVLPTTTTLASITVTIIKDDKVVDSDFILQLCDTATKVLTIRNDNKDTITSTIDFTKTIFRNAQLDKYNPSDQYNPGDP